MRQTVLILGGSGKIGSHTADAFWNAGWEVRHYDRKTGDMTAAAMGADVIVNGLNPPAYHDWERTIPAITAQVIAAAKASGATVIIPGNIYNFGDQPGVLDENTPQTAHTTQGRKCNPVVSSWSTRHRAVPPRPKTISYTVFRVNNTK